MGKAESDDSLEQRWLEPAAANTTSLGLLLLLLLLLMTTVVLVISIVMFRCSLNVTMISFHRE
jgi:hypothetical protein